MHHLEDGFKMCLYSRMAVERSDTSRLGVRGIAKHAKIILVPNPSPCGPAPNVCEFRKIIAGASSGLFLETAATDEHDSRVVFVTRKIFFAECEERCVRYAIVLKNDSFFNIAKEPGYGAADSFAAPKIVVSKISMNITVPVDLVKNFSNISASPPLAFNVGARPVGCDKKLLGLYFSDLFKYDSGWFGSVEHEK